MRAFASIIIAGLIALGTACARDSAPAEKQEPAAEGAAMVATAAAHDEPEHTCAGDGSCCGGKMQTAPENAAVPDDAVWTTMKVSGMKCDGCANRIRTSLASVDGILGITADHATGEVKIAAAPGTQDVTDKVKPHLDALGYKVLDI